MTCPERAYANRVKCWIAAISLNPDLYGTHSVCKVLPAEIYRQTGNLEICRQMLGHRNITTTVTETYGFWHFADAASFRGCGTVLHRQAAVRRLGSIKERHMFDLYLLPNLAVLALALSSALGILGVIFDFRRSGSKDLTGAGWVAIVFICASAFVSLRTLALETEAAAVRERNLQDALAEERLRDQAAVDERDRLLAEIEELNTALEASERDREILLSRGANIAFELAVYFDPDKVRERAETNPWLKALRAEAETYRDEPDNNPLFERCFGSAATPGLCRELGRNEVFVDWRSPAYAAWRSEFGEDVWIPGSFLLLSLDHPEAEDYFEYMAAKHKSWPAPHTPSCPSWRQREGLARLASFHFRAQGDDLAPAEGTGIIVNKRYGLPIGFLHEVPTQNLVTVSHLAERQIALAISNDITYQSRVLARRARAHSFTHGDYRMPRAVELSARFVEDGDVELGFDIRWLPASPSHGRQLETLNFRGPSFIDGAVGHHRDCLIVHMEISEWVESYRR